MCNDCGQTKLLVDFYNRDENRTTERCKDCLSETYYKPYYKKNKEKYAENVKRWRAENGEKAKSTRKSYESSPEVKLRKKIRNMITRKIKSDEELRVLVEAQFENDQSWKNYGTVWSVTFKAPLKDFNLSDPEYYAKASSYENVGIKSLL